MMKLGTSTYAFFWHLSEQNPIPSSLTELLKLTKKMGGEVFQICDYPQVEKMSEKELKQIVELAKDLDIELELGTRGVAPEHLHNYLRIAQILNVKVLRTMFHTADDKPTNEEIYKRLTTVMPEYENAQVKIAIETYEQVPTKEIVDIIKRINNPYLGVCLDPGNTVAALEHPNDVINQTAPYVKNLHVKDFTFSRKDGWVGFTLSGCPLGEGLLDLNYMIDALKKEKRDVNAIIELWLPFIENIEKTLKLEKEWIQTSINYLRRTLQ
ncbi:sugar phosphate isomerase/epimerase family protein [Oceanobacillus sp. AG]|uniref:sugar phosphate isomerase/epimerase family protein n=1 Tax=Oceanobacillus sp. AG TaxID=2681969 RepID=UPI00351A101A